MEEKERKTKENASTQTEEEESENITSVEIQNVVRAAAAKKDLVSILSLQVPAGKTITAAALLLAISLALGKKVRRN